MIRRPPRSTRTDHSFPTRRSSDLHRAAVPGRDRVGCDGRVPADIGPLRVLLRRSEEHTSELQSLMRISYAVFCLKKKKNIRERKKKTIESNIDNKIDQHAEQYHTQQRMTQLDPSNNTR